LDILLLTALLAVSLVLLGVLFQTILFYFAWYYERRGNPEGAEVDGDETEIKIIPGFFAIIREWLSMSFLIFTYPLRLVHDASPVRTKVQGKTPIIFVHGYGGNSANMAWMQLMLKRRGWDNVYAVSYTPPTIKAEKLAQQVTRHVEHILAMTGAEKAIVIGHSMGGVLIRYALLHLGLKGKVEKVISLGSPHQGTRIASLFMAKGAAAQMRHQSNFIQTLERHPHTPGGAQFYSIYSNFDNFILPSNAAMLEGNCKNIHIPYLGHTAMLYSPAVLRQVEQCLDEGSIAMQKSVNNTAQSG
jgi:triacylglycerol esterase/lipase EstA (alpha/beta hydrolase family)